jgi:hypothetical protein
VTSTFTAAAAAAERMTVRPGLIAAALCLCVYGALALTVDFPRAAIGIQSDEATYYMMGHSLAEDGDLTYRYEDLVRVWREFSTGPAGVFLKKGQRINGTPDPDRQRLFFGKSFIYPVFAAPFVKLFGTNGFLVLHAILLTLVVFCGYLFLHARAPAMPSLLLATGFVGATVVPVYFVWITPELFNFSLGCLAYFCWLYKKVATRDRSPAGTAWMFSGRSDLVASALLGILTFSKPSNALLFAPIVIWQLVGSTLEGSKDSMPSKEPNRRSRSFDFLRSFDASRARRLRVAMASAAVFALVTAGLFGINIAISGDWNYQGGRDRQTYYSEFPFQNQAPKTDIGVPKSRDEALTNIIFNRRVFTTNLVHNAGYVFFGRYAGLFAYFFPAVFAIAAFLGARGRRRPWQWFVLASGLAQIVLFIIATPYTWNGGGGSVGNRYFMSAYGVFLFLLPPIASIGVSLVPWIVGSIFVAPLVLNPFSASFYPGSNPKSGALRLLPVELTLIYDLPINNEPTRVRQWYGDNPGQHDPGFQIYFLDDNSYGREVDKSFWTRGESRAEFLIKTDRPMKRAVFTLTAGPLATDVTIAVDGRSQRVHVDSGATQQVTFALGPGFPYQGTWPVWRASVSSSTGFTPVFHGSDDTRYLGVRVKPVLVP